MKSKAENSKTGSLGEKIATKYLKDRGFTILCCNYRKKYGEIDIIAQARETETIRFIEVKTVSHETKQALEHAVTHETWKPEELVHRFKLIQIRKTAEAWIMEQNWKGKVQVDVIAIRIISNEKYACVNFIENITE